MAFWLSAALLNIFGRGSHSSGTVPENRTWTAFSGASSDSSSKAAAVPGHSRQPLGLVRTPSGRRLRTRGGSDALAPPPVPGAPFQRPSTVFSARLLPVLELPRAPSGPKSAPPRGQRVASAFIGTYERVPRAAGASLPLGPTAPRRGATSVPHRGSSVPTAPWGFVLRLTERAGEEASGGFL